MTLPWGAWTIEALVRSPEGMPSLHYLLGFPKKGTLRCRVCEDQMEMLEQILAVRWWEGA